MGEKSLRQEIKENLPTLLKMMERKREGVVLIRREVLNGTHVREFDYEEMWLQAEEDAIEDDYTSVYTLNEFITRYFFTLKRFLFKLRNEVKEE